MVTTGTCILFLVIAVLLGYVIGSAVMMHILVDEGENYFIKWWQKARQLEEEAKCPDEVEPRSLHPSSIVKTDGPIRGLTMDQIKVQRFPNKGEGQRKETDGMMNFNGYTASTLTPEYSFMREEQMQMDFDPDDDSPIPELIDLPDLPEEKPKEKPRELPEWHRPAFCNRPNVSELGTMRCPCCGSCEYCTDKQKGKEAERLYWSEIFRRKNNSDYEEDEEDDDDEDEFL